MYLSEAISAKIMIYFIFISALIYFSTGNNHRSFLFIFFHLKLTRQASFNDICMFFNFVCSLSLGLWATNLQFRAYFDFCMNHILTYCIPKMFGLFGICFLPHVFQILSRYRFLTKLYEMI